MTKEYKIKEERERQKLSEQWGSVSSSGHTYELGLWCFLNVRGFVINLNDKAHQFRFFSRSHINVAFILRTF